MTTSREDRPDMVAVVDRDALGLEVAVRRLRELGCHVLGFTSPALALQHVVARRFDMVVDTQSGRRIEGRSLASALRARLGSACPTLVLVHVPEADLAEGGEYDAVLTKPVSVIELLAALDLTRLRRASDRKAS